MKGRNDLETELLSGVAGLYILGLFLLVWASVKAVELVLRVMIAHPENRWLWAALGSCLLSVALVVLTQGQNQQLDVMASIATTVLLTLAKGIEIYHDQLFQRHMSRELLVEQVLTEPWFQA